MITDFDRFAMNRALGWRRADLKRLTPIRGWGV